MKSSDELPVFAVDAKKAMCFTLDSVLMEIVEKTVGIIAIKELGSISTKKQAAELWGLWKKDLEDDEKYIIGIIGKDLYSIYSDIAKIGEEIFKKSNSKDEIPSFEDSFKLGGILEQCQKIAETEIGIPKNVEANALVKSMTEYSVLSKQKEKAEAAVYCRHKAYQVLNMMAVSEPFYKPLAEVLKHRCKKCPYLEKNEIEQ
ncbi:MAG: hypothetical protein PHC66_01635 [Candidatus Nanoarchaeia archaeon]|nr:hypothetical protein [Candidatus Nanoarchaeia archaeon]MDD5238914.1 hypothetical protein [Candidatus Nanoarchaeia archaeon]